MRVQPITCYRPTPEAAPTFAALPYDVFNRVEAAAYVAEHPDSFLAIDRPETQFEPDADMYADRVYAKAAELLNAAVNVEEITVSSPAPALKPLKFARFSQAFSALSTSASPPWPFCAFRVKR